MAGETEYLLPSSLRSSDTHWLGLCPCLTSSSPSLPAWAQMFILMFILWAKSKELDSD